ncbi:MAG: DUF5050 domain-containing protein [Defluviitaleaceae bacterium]|nr:DUF5050 domain-containing protein [Defluviitaleaceae bacterium]
MSGNIANGGLVVKWRGNVIFARPNEWFMNADDDFIYYSNRNDRNRLYRKQDSASDGKMLVKRSCANVLLFGDSIYFISEEERKIYRCSKDGKGLTLCSNTEAADFAVLADGTVYASPNARRVCASGSKVFFADKGNENNLFALTSFDTRSGETAVFPDIRPSSINVHGNTVYYTDRNRQNKIYRLETSGGSMTVFGTSAEHLHVIDDWLYFMTNKKWKRLSLLDFGDAEDI